MSKHRLAISIVLVVTLLVPGFSASLAQPVAAQPAPAFSAGSGSMLIVENAGQWPEAARFQVWNSPLGAGTAWLAQDAIWLVVSKPVDKDQVDKQGGSNCRASLGSWSLRDGAPSTCLPVYASAAIKLTFPGSSLGVRIEPFQPADTVVSYFYGNDPAQWRPDVPVWHGVRYVDLYPGVDLVLGGEGHAWRIEAAPGAAVDRIKLQIEGAQIRSAKGSQLVLEVDDWMTPLTLPLAAFGYQVEGWSQQETSSTLPHSASFLPSLRQAPPINNPSALVFSSFVGGSLADEANALVVDGANNIVVTGMSESLDFPTTPGSFDPTPHGGMCGNYPCTDGLVLMLDATASEMIFATFIGGSEIDSTGAIAVDATNHLYVTGRTRSADFPSTPNAFDPDFNGGVCFDIPCQDAFVIKLSPTGDQLVFATFLGGSRSDGIASITLDQQGNANLAGSTNSSDFPTTPDAFDSNFNGGACGVGGPCPDDGFVSSLDRTGSELLHSTFIGGAGYDYINESARDSRGNIFLTGATGSENFPTTTNAFDTSLNGGHQDAFVARFDPTLSDLYYSTFLGGTGMDYGVSIQVDSAGQATVAGKTDSADYPTTPQAYNRRPNDIFVTRLEPMGNDLELSTFLGGGLDEFVTDLKLSSTGSIILACQTRSTDFPTTSGAFATYKAADKDGFIAVLAPSGNALEHGTYLGGSSHDLVRSLVSLQADKIVVAGTTASPDFPSTPGSFDPVYNGGFGDVSVTQLVMTPYSADVIAQVDHPITGTLISGTTHVAGFAIDRGSGGWRTGIDEIHIYLDGTYATGQMIGGAVYGSYRPDVAAQYGAQFRDSGWSLDWDTSGIAPGLHWLYIYAHRTTDNAWTLIPPHSVVVTSGHTAWLPLITRRN